MASAPGPFFSAAPVAGPAAAAAHHLLVINPTKEAVAVAAGFQIDHQAVVFEKAKSAPLHRHHEDAPPQQPQAYPITVTTAGQQAPRLVPQTNNVAVAPAAASPVIMKSLGGADSITFLSKKRPRSSSVTLALSGGFTLPPQKVQVSSSSGSSSPNKTLYSSASRATVKAQVIVRQEQQQKQQALKAVAPVMAAAQPLQSQPCPKDYKYRKVVGGKQPIPKTLDMVLLESPQTYLDRLMESRGYSTQKFCSLEGGYYCKPSPLQKASHGLAVVKAVRSSNASLLQSMMDCGLSPNPCNNFGESIVHMVCRRGHAGLLGILKKAGCSVQVTDDFGRTPLHDACWTAEPALETVDMILRADSRLLHVVDCRGSPPLAYVKKEHWKTWMEFISKKADEYWPPRGTGGGEEPPPALSQQAPHSQSLPDPKHAASIQDASLIASGQLEPQVYLERKKNGTAVKQEEDNNNNNNDKSNDTPTLTSGADAEAPVVQQ